MARSHGGNMIEACSYGVIWIRLVGAMELAEYIYDSLSIYILRYPNVMIYDRVLVCICGVCVSRYACRRRIKFIGE